MKVKISRVVAVVLVPALAASPAWADTTTKVFPLAGAKLPARLAKAPVRLTTALATSIDAEVTDVPIEDAAGLLDCDMENTGCLEAIAKSMKANRLVFGTVTHASGGVRVTLTRFDIGPSRVQRTFELTGTTQDEYAEQLARDVQPLFEEARPAPVEPRPVAPVAEPAAPDPTPVARDERAGGVTATTWVLLGTGVVAAGIGGGFYMSGRSYRDKVDSAPTEVREDFDRLLALEETGKSRTQLGAALMIGGGALAAIAVVRAIVQRERVVTTETQAVRLEPVPVTGGAALVLTVTR